MLPPYPELVTKLTTVKVNHPDNRSASAYVAAVLQLPVSDNRYQRDEFGTKCNFFGVDVLHVMGYPVAHMRAKGLIRLWRLAGGPIIRMVIQDALSNANLGCPTLFGLEEPGETWHVGVVLPQPPTLKVEDLMVANVGARNFYGRQLKYAVQADDLKRVEFFGAP